MAKRSSKESDNGPGKSPDPYVRAFLRQAVAIIAAERGFNDISNAKLQSVANQLGLTDEAFGHAVEQLKQPGDTLGLNQYEKSYIAYVTRIFESMRGDVLTIRAEEVLVDRAAAKYQIDPVRAHQLIQKTAEQCRVGTISHSDAKQFARQLVKDAAGNRTSLTSIEIHRLHHVCEKWGLQETGVDRLLKSIFSRNRWIRRRLLMISLGTVTLVTSVIAAAGYAILNVNWQHLVPIESNLAENSFEPLSLENANGLRRIGVACPHWWDNRLIAAADQMVTRNPRATSWLRSVCSNSGDQLRSAYKKMVQQILDSPQSMPVAEDLVAMLYLNEPDIENADAIRKPIEDLLQTSRFTQTMTAGNIRKSSNALRMLGILLLKTRSDKSLHQDKRTTKVCRFAETLFGNRATEMPFDQFMKTATEVLCLDQWSHALRFSESQPKSVAGFLGELEKRQNHESNLSINVLRTNVVQSIIRHDSVQWPTIRNSIRISIDNSDIAGVDSWIDLMNEIDEGELVDFLMKEIGRRLNLQTENDSRIAVLESIRRFRVGRRVGRLEDMMNANQRLELKLCELSAPIRTKDFLTERKHITALHPAGLPQMLDELVRANNLIFAWIIASKSNKDYTRFDQLLDGDLDWKQINSVNAPSRQPTASEKRRLREALAKLFDPNSDSVSSRVAALEVIRRVAQKFDDLDFQSASRLVEYMFSITDDRESLAIDRTLPSISHWVNAMLAFADQIESKHLQLDAVLDKMNLLGIRNVQLERSPNWRDLIQQRIIEHCLQLPKRGAASVDIGQWQQLASRLEPAYVVRLELTGSGENISNRQAFPENWLAGIRRLVLTQPETASRLHKLRSLDLIRMNPDPLNRVVAANRVFNEIMFERFDHDSGLPNPVTKPTNDIELNQGQHLLQNEFVLHQFLLSIHDELTRELN